MPRRKLVTLTAYWGNDDASSSIKIPTALWEKIKRGEEYGKPAWSWYEGERFRVCWTFENREVCIVETEEDITRFDSSIDDLQVE